MSVDLDLCYMPATEIAGHIRAGSLTATRVVENSLARIAAVNPKLNAFCFVYPDEALAIASELDRQARTGKLRGPLHGVPFAIKDLTPTKGKRTTRGSYAYEHWVPDHDAPIVEALNQAGGVMVGKTDDWGQPGGRIGPFLSHPPKNPFNGSAKVAARGKATAEVGGVYDEKTHRLKAVVPASMVGMFEDGMVEGMK
jgi:Asp-tRNA(Asn)/Glu-tRNA(Gln) amidotransferase A subunit family amidase